MGFQSNVLNVEMIIIEVFVIKQSLENIYVDRHSCVMCKFVIMSIVTLKCMGVQGS